MWTRAFAFVAVLSMLAGVAVAEVGFLQISAEPGVEVLLDGERVGATSEEVGGLFVVDVAVADRVLRLEREGFEAQEVAVRVSAGRVSVRDVD